MKLYFENNQGIRREIGEPIDLAEAHIKMMEFCKERNFEIYYTIATVINGETRFDVGSHTEFFFLDNEIQI